MRITVFRGPSISAREAYELAPSIIFRPPAEQGDLLTAVEQDGAQVLGLIDGTFHQSLSVWHNEVCYLLHRGISIYGASSMGALRAVETSRYGMVGVGSVFKWYATGLVTGDDEVALLHGDESMDFRPLSIPMVNIRSSLNSAVGHEEMSEAVAEIVLQICASLFYADRTVAAIVERCREANLETGTVLAVRSALTDGYVDVKKSDAMELLSEVSAIAEGKKERKIPPPFAFKQSSLFETLYNVDRKISVEEGEVALERVGEHFALYSPNYDQTRRDAINRSLIVYLGHLMAITPTQAEIDREMQLFIEARQLTTAQDLEMWLQQNAFSGDDLRCLLTEECIYRKLTAWAVKSRPFDRGCKRLLDQLRLSGTFASWASAACEKEVTADYYAARSEYRSVSDAPPASVAKLHGDAGFVRVTGDAQIFAEYLGFENVETLSDALRKAVIFNDVRSRVARLIT